MRITALVAACFLATASHAQDQELMEAATAYVTHPVQQNMFDAMLSAEGIMAQMGLVGDQIPPEMRERIAVIVSEELATIRDQMESAMITGMAESFTLEEINALNAFYSSPEGASAMSKMNPYMQRTMASIGPAFQQMQANLARRLQEEFAQ